MSERLIQIGEDFQVYPLGTEIENIESPMHYPFDRISSVINLEVDEFVIPFDFFAHSNMQYNGLQLTPFNPEMGYTFDQRDFDKESRLEKVQNIAIKLSEEERQSVELAAPLVQSTIGNLSEEGESGLELSAKILVPLRLRLQFPMCSFDSMTDIPSIDFASGGDAVHFLSFFPTETGPIFSVYEEYSESGQLIKCEDNPYGVGHEIHLPRDPHILAQIIGKFVVVPERLLLTQLMNLPEYFNRHFKG